MEDEPFMIKKAKVNVRPISDGDHNFILKRFGSHFKDDDDEEESDHV